MDERADHAEHVEHAEHERNCDLDRRYGVWLKNKPHDAEKMVGQYDYRANAASPVNPVSERKEHGGSQEVHQS